MQLSKPRRQFIIIAALLLLLLLLLATPALLLPVGAQSPTPPPGTPSVTVTPTDPMSVVDEPTPSGIFAVFQEQGIIIGILVLLIVVALVILIAIVVKNIESIAGRFNVMASLFAWIDARRSTGPGLRAYLDWLRREYGRLPQIGIATEQVALDLAKVHVPLRVIERAEIETHQRRMRGELNADEAEEEQGSGRKIRMRLQSEDADELHIFTLLSDPKLLEQRRKARERQRKQEEARRRKRNKGEQVHLPFAAFEEREIELPQTTTRLLLLGDAGSGKTTTLRYAALRCAVAFRKGQPKLLSEAGLGLYLTRVPLPIYVRLTHFATTLPADLHTLPPQERQRYIGAPPSLFLEWLDNEAAKQCQVPPGTLSSFITRKGGHVLLLLDGLDEAGDEQRRAYLTELITNLANAYPDNRYVVASRTAGYGGRVQLPGFLERHLSPLDAEEIRAVIQKWFVAVDDRLVETGRSRQQENARTQTAKLWGVIERNTRLFEMATNPLLVTAMALLQFNNVRLPDQRAKLYEKLVELLLDLWRKQQLGNDALVSSVAQLATEQRRIEYLALQMQKQSQQAREVAVIQAQDWLSPLYMQRLQIDREAADGRVRQLLHSLALDSGLIQQRDNGYSFSHYTFQEYLAARALDGMDNQEGQPASVDFLLERSGETRWRETLLLAAGHWSNGQQLTKTDRLIAGLLAQGTIETWELAGEALADIGPIEEFTVLRNETAALLCDIPFDPARCPDPRKRNAIATLLDRLDADQRSSLDPTHPDYWAERIAPGPFVMGDDNSEDDDEKPAFTYHIPRPYALARYPVTNRQYARFLEALRGSGRNQEAEQRRPRYWPGRSYRAGEGNHPVVGVSWEDACAFAQWANDTFLTPEQRARGAQIRLPTEPEWERAAAYPLTLPADNPGMGRREYPWGDWPADLTDMTNDSINSTIPANTDESAVGGIAAVGIFPQGRAACGAEELAGNVWEWCSTPYQRYPLPEDLSPETIDTTEDYKDRTYVLRGGSWHYNRTFARCACRIGHRPGNGLDNFGFRLAHLFS
jgi:formylglycine-generating enzyme required for sulfatase activity